MGKGSRPEKAKTLVLVPGVVDQSIHGAVEMLARASRPANAGIGYPVRRAHHGKRHDPGGRLEVLVD